MSQAQSTSNNKHGNNSTLSLLTGGDMINEIEALRFDIDDDSTKQKINALYKKLTPQIKELYKDRLKEILGTSQTQFS